MPRVGTSAMSISSSDSDDGAGGDRVDLGRKRRERYSKLEERRMWYFFARELKAGNDDALRKRPQLWEMYELQEPTKKKKWGLESHFRKYMLPKIHKANMARDDLFLLLRFFKAKINPRQRNELQKMHGCDIDCDVDGTFVRARVELGREVLQYPTEEQENTILRPPKDANEEDDDDDGEDSSDSEVEVLGEEDQQPQKQQQKRIRESVAREISPIDCSTPKTKRIQNNQEAKGGNEDDEGDEGSSDSEVEVLEENRQSQKQQEKRTEELLDHEISPTDCSTSKTKRMPNRQRGNASFDQQRIESQKVAQSTKQKLPRLQSDLAKLKRHFVEGSLSLLEGKCTQGRFMEPFFHMHGGKYAKFARGIDWLVDSSRSPGVDSNGNGGGGGDQNQQNSNGGDAGISGGDQ